jgi:hypothetical protein
VKHSQITILVFILLFIVASILLNITGIAHIVPADLIGYSLIFYGVATVYTSFGNKNKFFVFAGSVIFLGGILISLPAHIDFIRPLNILIPSSILIAGISLLIVYFDDVNNKSVLIASIILIAAGIVFIFTAREIHFLMFGESILRIIRDYWLALLVISGITIILKR